MSRVPALALHASIALATIIVSPLHAQDRFGAAPGTYAPPQGQPAGPPPYPPASPGSQPGMPPPGDSRGGFAPAPATPGAPGIDLDALMAIERQDHGVAPTPQLHAGAMHGPTPSSIPGGQIVTTKGVLALLADRSLGAVVFDVLGSGETLPGAIPAVPASQAGSFEDGTQQQFGQFLEQVTQGRRNVPLVFYCASPQCWMSYNASLRAIRLGYTNVMWYRGGLEAWRMAGQMPQRAAGYGTPMR